MFVRGILLLALVTAVAGCGTGEPGKPQVVASFYPLQYVAERIAGPRAEVRGLTAPGVEPHDVELSPRQVADLSSADVVLFERGFQPAVDDALRNDPPEHVVDATEVVDLRVAGGDPDPHFWLDPALLGQVANAFTRAITEAVPGSAAAFRSANRRLQQDLRSLDRDYRTGLGECRTRSVVVSHDAFGYLGARYRLQVYAIAGLSPSSEPSAKRLGELADVVRREDVTTVFTERLASPRLARTLADELGLRTAVLDPVEGLSDRTSGEDYVSLMRANLAALREAGGCR